jgi:hypothetical protein
MIFPKNKGNMADNAEGRYVWVAFGQRIALNNPGWWYNEKEGWLSEKEKQARDDNVAKQLGFYNPGDTWNSQWVTGKEQWSDNGDWTDQYSHDADTEKTEQHYKGHYDRTYKRSSASGWGRKDGSRQAWSSGSKGSHRKWDEWDYVTEEPYGVNPPPPPAVPKPKPMPTSGKGVVVPPRQLAKDAISALQKVENEKDEENKKERARQKEVDGVRMFTRGQGPPPEPKVPPMLKPKIEEEEAVNAEPHEPGKTSGAIKSEPDEEPEQCKQPKTTEKGTNQPKEKEHKKDPSAQKSSMENEAQNKQKAKAKNEPDAVKVKEEKNRDKKDDKRPEKGDTDMKDKPPKEKKDKDKDKQKDTKDVIKHRDEKEHDKHGKIKKEKPKESDDIDKGEKKRKVDDLNTRLAAAYERGKKHETPEDELARLRRTQMELQVAMCMNNQRMSELNEKKKEGRPQAKARVASTTASGDSKCPKPAVPRPAA